MTWCELCGAWHAPAEPSQVGGPARPLNIKISAPAEPSQVGQVVEEAGHNHEALGVLPRLHQALGPLEALLQQAGLGGRKGGGGGEAFNSVLPRLLQPLGAMDTLSSPNKLA